MVVRKIVIIERERNHSTRGDSKKVSLGEGNDLQPVRSRDAVVACSLVTPDK
jgi:hypothetical protein